MTLPQTPESSKTSSENPFSHLPNAPQRMRSKLDSQHITENLELLCVPSTMNSNYEAQGRRLVVKSHLFDAALNRMRQGEALQKLRLQQEEADAGTKGRNATTLSLGRRLPERRMSNARSA